MNFKSLSEIQEEAENFITGGMSSSFRANLYTGLPMYANKAQGPRFTDCTGKEKHPRHGGEKKNHREDHKGTKSIVNRIGVVEKV